MRLNFLAGGIIPLLVVGCPPREEALAPNDCDEDMVVLVIHGGAGVLNEDELKEAGLKQEQFEEGLADALAAGYQAWRDKKSSVDMVEAAIRVMEDSPLFNAGKGAALNEDGQAELDAAIMEGKMNRPTKKNAALGKLDPRKRAGAVAAVGHIKNPISASRAVMEMPDQRHVLLVGVGAETFVFSKEVQERYPGRIKRVPNVYFWTKRRLKDIRNAFKEDEKKRKEKEKKRQKLRPSQKSGTVGAVALDREKNLAAGTSTGGLTNKMRGRVGDSPLIGAGTYADNRACGVSCTGTGEVFIRHAVAHDVVARMLYGKCGVEKAVRETIGELPDEKDGVGGLIALDRKGRYAFGMSKELKEGEGMYRGYVTAGGKLYVAVKKKFKEMTRKRYRAERAKDEPRKWTSKRRRAEGVSQVKGALVFAGGGLRFNNAQVWSRFVKLAGGKHPAVVVVPAPADPRKSGQAVVDNLNHYGARAEVVDIAPNLKGVDYKKAARDPTNVKKLRDANGIWFLGGDQHLITQALLDEKGKPTPALQAIWHAYRNGAVLGGSSAGAAVMSRWMFTEAMESLDTLKHGITPGKHVRPGLGFIGNDWFVDQHFLTRGRFARALNAMRDLRYKYGIGVDEDTAVVFQGGRFDVVGYKGALILDISHHRSDRKLPAFQMTNVRLTYLDAGDSMDARTWVVTVSQWKRDGKKIDPNALDFRGSFDRPEQFYFPDMLGTWAIYEAMTRVLDGKRKCARGLAFAQPEPRGKKDDLGFEFTIRRGRDTVGWYTARGGNETYTVLNVYVDITPVKLACPLYTPVRP
jgi:cyanophycinase